MSVNTCLIYRCLSSASAVIRSWFIYELQKSTTIAFSRNSLYTFYSRNPTCGIPPCLRISNRKYPPMPSEFHNREPPLPFGNPRSRPWYGMDIFWNRPLFQTGFIFKGGWTYFFLFRVFFLDARLKSTNSCTPLILVLLKKTEVKGKYS